MSTALNWNVKIVSDDSHTDSVTVPAGYVSQCMEVAVCVCVSAAVEHVESALDWTEHG